MKKKIMFCTAVIVTALALSACGANKSSKNQSTAVDLLNSNPEENQLPITNPPAKMTMASTISATSAGQTLSLGDIECFKELEKITGVQMEYTTVSADKLSLLFASDDLPDMIFTNWDTLGGVYKYALDGQIISLDEAIGKSAPNLVNIIKKDNSVYYNLIDVDDNIYYFPFLRRTPELRVFEGYQIRKDWLEKLNLEVPKTVDALHDVLKAFKENDPNGNGKADEIPFISDKKTSGVSQAMNWWGISDFYVDNGVVKCGWTDDKYKEYLTTLSNWYGEGLIDPDFLTCDTTQFRSKAVSQVAGAWYGRAAGVLGVLEQAMKSVNPDFSLVGMPWLSNGNESGYAMPSKYIQNVLGIGIAVTSKCENPELAVKWCDYAYGEKGNLLFNFGIENDSYTMENGIPTYTKKITENPNGLSMSEALASVAIPGNYAFEQSPYYFDQFMSGSQKNAIDVWAKGNTDRILPALKYNEKEMDVVTSRKNEINTYVSEMTSKFIVGKEPIENYDEFVKKINDMGIDEIVKCMQDAYDRRKVK